MAFTTKTFESERVSISAGAEYSWTIDVSLSGYTPLCFHSYETTQADALCITRCKLDGNQAIIKTTNVKSRDLLQVAAVVRVLYVKRSSLA